jgi:putative ABC transport system permease protein
MGMVLNAVRMAVAALLRNRMRSTLTALGISVGIAAVMSTVALGAGSTAAIEAQLDALGEDFVWIMPGSSNTGGVRGGWNSRRTLTPGDAYAIEAEVPEIGACSSVVNGREQIIIGNRNWNTRLVGVAPAYFDIRRWRIAAGSTFSPQQVQQRAKVAMLGSNVADELFGTTSPIGAVVRIGQFPFTVIGVLAPRGSDRSGVNQDDVVVMPYTTAQRSIEGRTYVSEIICSTTSPEDTLVAEWRASEVLRVRHDIAVGEDDDFYIRRPQESLNLRLASMETLGLMLASVAFVSLVVGGVGIMNIMLVSVTERTREIGLRLAIGARESDIRVQFLIEAVVLGLVGAILGIAMGLIASQVISSTFGWQTIVSADAVGAAVGFAVAAGLIFGYFPASRAAALTPIDALRDE